MLDSITELISVRVRKELDEAFHNLGFVDGRITAAAPLELVVQVFRDRPAYTDIKRTASGDVLKPKHKLTRGARFVHTFC